MTKYVPEIKYSRRGLIAGMAGFAGITALAGPVAARAAPLGMPDAVSDAPRHWPLALTMATGAAGSGFAVFGPAWGQSVRRVTAIPLAYRVSGGGAANVLLIEQGAAQLGMTNLAVAAEAWTGHVRWTGGMALRGFRALFPIYDESLQIIASHGQGLIRPADLGGAVIGIGPAGSSSAALVPHLLASLGIVPANFRNGEFAAQVNDVLAGRLAACAFMEVTPLPALKAAAWHGQFNLLGFTTAEIRVMRKTLPALATVIIPAHSLPGQTVPVETIGSRAIAICRAELPDALAGAVTRAVLRDRSRIRQGLPDMIRPDRAWLADDPDIAVHPGAVPVLRWAGFAVPHHLARDRRQS